MKKTEFFKWLKSNVQHSKITKGYISGYFYINIYGFDIDDYSTILGNYQDENILKIKEFVLEHPWSGSIRKDSIQIIFLEQV
jgi:hypothetical protein